MNDTFLEKLQYDEDAPDVQSIMAQIRSYVAGAQPAAGAPGRAEPVTRGLEPAIYEDLEQARRELGSLHVGVYLTPTRAPVIGGLLHRVRRAFHQLVVYYVDRLADAQTRINMRLVSTLSGIVAYIDGEDQGEKMRRLDAKVLELEDRMRDLEAALNQTGPGQNQKG